MKRIYHWGETDYPKKIKNFKPLVFCSGKLFAWVGLWIGRYSKNCKRNIWSWHQNFELMSEGQHSWESQSVGVLSTDIKLVLGVCLGLNFRYSIAKEYFHEMRWSSHPFQNNLWGSMKYGIKRRRRGLNDIIWCQMQCSAVL